MALTLEDIQRAAGRLAGVAHRTPLERSTTFSELTGRQVYLKCENLQRTGSFKIRGAYNRLAALSADQAGKGVVAASAGNHAQGVALAARLLDIAPRIFMPETTPLAKVEATRGYGAAVELAGATYEDAQQAANEWARSRGVILIHAFDDEDVIAGQGTVGLEILQQIAEVEAIVVPVGGGGLIAGIATAAKALRPAVKVFGVQAAAAACFTASLAAGHPLSVPPVPTIADGVAVHQPGALTFPLVQRLVDGILSVDEAAISKAMVLLLERAKLLVEGAGAVGLAALLEGIIPLGSARNVAVVLSGGNADITLVARVIEQGLASAGRYLAFEVWLPDRPGELLEVLKPLQQERANILTIEHRRPVSLAEVAVMITVETRDLQHGRHLVRTLRGRGYRVDLLPLSNPWRRPSSAAGGDDSALTLH